jgi:VanZ family protein
LKLSMQPHVDSQRTFVMVWRVTMTIALIVIMHLATMQVEYAELEDINDKVSHLLAFYVLSLLADFSFPRHGSVLSKALALLGYGLLIEVVQYFIPYRTCSLLDLSADGAGIALYWLSVPALKYLPLLRSRWKV